MWESFFFSLTPAYPQLFCFRNDAHRLLCVNHVNGYLRAFRFCFSAFNLLLFWSDDPKKLTAMSYNEQRRKYKAHPHREPERKTDGTESADDRKDKLNFGNTHTIWAACAFLTLHTNTSTQSHLVNIMLLLLLCYKPWLLCKHIVSHELYTHTHTQA